jgi:hypothetical protein
MARGGPSAAASPQLMPLASEPAAGLRNEPAGGAGLAASLRPRRARHGRAP